MNNNYTPIPILNRMSEIIDIFLRSPNSLRANDLLHQLDIPKATFYRLLHSMCANGFLSYSPDAGVYSLGLKFHTAYTSMDERASHVREAAMPHLNYLANQVQETVKLSVLSGLQSYTIASVEGNRPLRISIDTGAVFPLHAGAAGKVLMCSIGDDAIEQYYLRYGTRYTDATIMTIPEMKEELHQIGIRGYAVDNGEYMPEIRAVAAPIKDAYGAIIAAVSVAYPVSNQDSIAPAHLATQVMQTAHAISLTYAAKEAWPQPAKLVHAQKHTIL